MDVWTVIDHTNDVKSIRVDNNLYDRQMNSSPVNVFFISISGSPFN